MHARRRRTACHSTGACLSFPSKRARAHAWTWLVLSFHRRGATPTTSPSIGMLLVFTIELSQLRRSRFEPTEAHDYEARQARTKSSAMAAFRAHT